MYGQRLQSLVMKVIEEVKLLLKEIITQYSTIRLSLMDGNYDIAPGLTLDRGSLLYFFSGTVICQTYYYNGVEFMVYYF